MDIKDIFKLIDDSKEKIREEEFRKELYYKEIRGILGDKIAKFRCLADVLKKHNKMLSRFCEERGVKLIDENGFESDDCILGIHTLNILLEYKGNRYNIKIPQYILKNAHIQAYNVDVVTHITISIQTYDYIYARNDKLFDDIFDAIRYIVKQGQL